MVRLLTSSVLKQDFVVEAEPQLWHARQEHSHLDGAHDFTAQHITISTHLRQRERAGSGRYGSRTECIQTIVQQSPILS